MSNATKLAHAVLRQLIEAGVSDFVVSPGSRTTMLQSFAPVELQLPTFIQLPSKLCTARINC